MEDCRHDDCQTCCCGRGDRASGRVSAGLGARKELDPALRAKTDGRHHHSRQSLQEPDIQPEPPRNAQQAGPAWEPPCFDRAAECLDHAAFIQAGDGECPAAALAVQHSAKDRHADALALCVGFHAFPARATNAAAPAAALQYEHGATTRGSATPAILGCVARCAALDADAAGGLFDNAPVHGRVAFVAGRTTKHGGHDAGQTTILQHGPASDRAATIAALHATARCCFNTVAAACDDRASILACAAVHHHAPGIVRNFDAAGHASGYAAKHAAKHAPEHATANALLRAANTVRRAAAASATLNRPGWLAAEFG